MGLSLILLPTGLGRPTATLIKVALVTRMHDESMKYDPDTTHRLAVDGVTHARTFMTMPLPDAGDGHPEGEPPSGSPLIDYRFSLANERTFLAWTRTSLALIGGGVAVLHLLADSFTGFVAAYVLVGLGVLVAAAGLHRWLRNEKAMLNGWALDPTRLPIVLAVGLGVVGVLLILD